MLRGCHTLLTPSFIQLVAIPLARPGFALAVANILGHLYRVGAQDACNSDREVLKLAIGGQYLIRKWCMLFVTCSVLAIQSQQYGRQ